MSELSKEMDRELRMEVDRLKELVFKSMGQLEVVIEQRDKITNHMRILSGELASLVSDLHE